MSRAEDSSFHFAQILVSPKGADPTELTAEETLRHLLGLGDRLLRLHRRVLHEMLFDSVPISSSHLAERLGGYLECTLTLWNANKHRAWIRVLRAGAAPESWEAKPGSGLLPAACGSPSLEDGGCDHLLLWNRDHQGPPEDLAAAAGDGALRGYARGDLYTVRWREDASEAERARWTESIGPVSARGRGLLVNPHVQEWLRFQGGVPIPAWRRNRG